VDLFLKKLRTASELSDHFSAFAGHQIDAAHSNGSNRALMKSIQHINDSFTKDATCQYREFVNTIDFVV